MVPALNETKYITFDSDPKRMKKEKKKVQSVKKETTTKSNHILYVAGFAIALAISLAFSSLYQADFVNIDDNEYVKKNERIKDISIESISSMFYSPGGDMYIPLVYLSYAVEYSFSEINPHLYHTDNVLLHIINSLLVLWLIWLLTKNLFASISISGLFALHPFHVESVAWLSERKDVLYAMFFLASIICYHFFSQKKQNKYYLFSLLLFLLSCMSKPMAITLPAVLLIYDYFYLKQHSWKILINKIPFLLIALAVAFVTIKMIDLSFKKELDINYTILDRALLVLYSISFYIQKTLLPVNLSAMYTYPEKTGALLPLYYIFCALLMLLMGYIALSKYCGASVKACFLFFLITIFPVLQFLPNTFTITADRYSYIPVLGIFGIVVYYADKLIQQKRISEKSAWKVMVVILITLSVATYNRSKVWANGISLYSDIVAKGQYKDFAICALGDLYDKNGEPLKALAVYQHADSVYPDRNGVKLRYAASLAEAWQYDKAIQQYLRCLALDSNVIGAYVNLGDAYLKTGKKEEALQILLKGHRLFPENNTCLYNIAYAYWSMENNSEAIKYFRIAAANKFQPAIDFLNRHNISIN